MPTEYSDAGLGPDTCIDGRNRVGLCQSNLYIVKYNSYVFSICPHPHQHNRLFLLLPWSQGSGHAAALTGPCPVRGDGNGDLRVRVFALKAQILKKWQEEEYGPAHTKSELSRGAAGSYPHPSLTSWVLV